jgi:hypothetical protein
MRSETWMRGVLVGVMAVAFATLCRGEARKPIREMSVDEVAARTLHPYSGTSVAGVDANTMTGKVMCGYQGWFTCPNDGSERGWFHWGSGVFEPGHCNIDLWPDVSELDMDELCPTPFKHADGSPAFVYSAMNPKTVNRHFKWMRDYGIDGVFVQRFVTEALNPVSLNHTNTVLDNCRAAANANGRVYAVMYDISGLRHGQLKSAIEDWKQLVDKMHLGKDASDKAYLHHNGKPVVAIWGIGFNDPPRPYTLAECAEFVKFVKEDKHYGGFTVMLGVPTYWRTLKNDSVRDPNFHTFISQYCDVVSPWMVGRVRNLDDVNEFAYNHIWKADLAWCKVHKKDYMPVVFPGFSWNNLKKHPSAFNSILRLDGQFLWHQYYAAKDLGATMIYQAMFDEVDEGTAIFKCTNNPPVGASKFLTYDGLDSDYYLWLVGQGGKMLRGELPASDIKPVRVK